MPDQLNQYRFFVSLFNHCYWVTGSILGSLLGAVLPFSTAGIEFSMTALFIAAYTEQWLTTKDHVPTLTGLLCTSLWHPGIDCCSLRRRCTGLETELSDQYPHRNSSIYGTYTDGVLMSFDEFTKRHGAWHRVFEDPENFPRPELDEQTDIPDAA